jgi:homoserine kinase
MTGGLNLSGQGFNLQKQALTPYTNYLAGATGIENQAANALTYGQGLGSSGAASAQAAANQYAAGQTTANAAQRAALQGTVSGLTDPIAALIAGLSKP